MKNHPRTQILLADDDLNFQRVVAYNLGEMGCGVTAAQNGAEALEAFRGGHFDLVLTDVRMPEMDGLALLAEIRRLDASVPIIIVTAHGDIDMAVEAMQAGATDFLTKPFDRAQFRAKIERALKLPRLEIENRALHEELINRFSFENMVGSSPAMRELFQMMGRVADRDTTVLILGESGTGKELVARGLHYNSSRREGRFVAINCASISPTLLESELFGHVKGAFTGADANREGRFQIASGGTLFLDEIGDMPLELQAKLLRVLQEKQIEPVGSSTPVVVNVRIVAATHRNLEQMVRDGEFRQDLYYRISVVPLWIPPLRDRMEDIPILVRHFLKQFGQANTVVDPEAIEKLRRHDWPGNVRELENTIERALALCEQPGRIGERDILIPEKSRTESAKLMQIPDEGLILDDVEKQLIQSALHKTGDNQTRAAELLGITRQTLIYRMHKHGIT